ncbi:unnamed protein product [Eruca vesicaria subsp. sativa]|uniref:Uncharacterized protein n=1 Tax=Eruca vesicaria subsp. sativa TaxID=29727 RepID=A0ABC8K1A1_ERUVS|nr:unnamed protein product [Eruca vesicaria subsp. sativa]
MASRHDSSSSDEHETSLNTSDGDKKIYHRHTTHQIQRLEAYFKECPHPDESQRLRLGEELKLKANQIKFWFQNKRTQTKTQNEKAANAALRTENMNIRRENEAMQVALNTVTCPPCGGPLPGQGERTLDLQNLRTQNTYLRQERDRLLNLVNTSEGHSNPTINALAYLHGPPLYPSASNNPYITYGTSSNHLVEPYSRERINIAKPTHPRKPLSDMEKAKMTEAMVSAVTEVVNLIRTEDLIWIKSSIDDRLVIDQKYYEAKFIKSSHFKIPNARIESSKEVVLIQMNAQDLVDMLLHTEKWANLFSTIVSEAQTIHMLDSIDLQGKYVPKLVYEQLHILSPLLPPREFRILRSCRQLEEDLWVIADVSYHEVDQFKTPVCSKRPSGCLIEALPHDFSKVTWMEHVEVDDKVRTHRIYKDLLCGGFGYGARRWTTTLKRMCERLSLGNVSAFPLTDHPGVVQTIKGRRNIMNLGERMLKDFAWMLKMPEKSGFPQQNTTSSSGVRISTRVINKAGQPPSFIVCAGMSLCLPTAPLQVYNVLKNVEVRHQWDKFCESSLVTEVARFVTGGDNNNCVNILRPSSTTNNGALMMIIQDSFIDALGGMVVYAPVDVRTAEAVFSGNANPSDVQILPSGFIISRDARPPSAADELDGGLDNCKTILTVAFQILTGGSTNFVEGQMEEWTTYINYLISSTIQTVKVMLNCNDGQ